MNSYDYLIWRPTDDLYHHDIKGQEWGKRNGPPYPLDSSDHSAAEKKAASGGSSSGSSEVVARKGSKVGHVSVNKEQSVSNRQLSLYNTENDTDRKVYEGDYATSLYEGGADSIYRHVYETTEDLTSPSASERVNLFADAYSKDRKTFSSYLNGVEQLVKEKQEKNRLWNDSDKK